jgi:hypothetical protein
MIEDAEIAIRFSRLKLNAGNFFVASDDDAFTVAQAVSKTLPEVKLLTRSGAQFMKWSDLVMQKQELWPIQFLLPGGAYIQ